MRRPAWRFVPVAALSAVVALAIAWWGGVRTRSREVEPVSLAFADRATTALVRVPTSDPRVVFYWMERLSDGE